MARGISIEYVRGLVEPFARGQYAADWKERALEVGALCDLLAGFCRENAHWSWYGDVSNASELSMTPTRLAIGRTLEEPLGDGLSLNMEFGEISSSDREILEKAVAGLDSAEKIVISAAARTIVDLDTPPELTIDLMNIVFEEALHLEAVGRLLGIQHSALDWLPPERLTNWKLICDCRTPREYMFTEHCLYEGRGTIASALGAHDLELAGLGRSVVRVMDAIAAQEANHNVSGYRWLKMLDSGKRSEEFRLEEIVRDFLAAEPLPDTDGSTRSIKAHFPLYLLSQYQEARDFYGVKSKIVDASRSCRQMGRLSIPSGTIYAGAKAIIAWCGAA